MLDADRFVAVDLEGNGGSPPEAIEVAAIEFDQNGIIHDRRAWLVRPRSPITQRATQIHGLTDADVAGAPDIADIKDDLFDILGRGPFVAHNAGSDVSVLRRSFPGYRPRAVIDTLTLSRKRLKGLSSYRLHNIVSSLDLLPEGDDCRPHRADYDCRACMALFLHLLRLEGTVEPVTRRVVL